jgi:energy-converting hydrogenase B subunit D
MTLFALLDGLCLALILAGAVLVVAMRNLLGAVMALSMIGLALTLLFVVLGAPDVAHAEVVVGAIAMPVLYLVAIGKCRTVVDEDQDLDEQHVGQADS